MTDRIGFGRSISLAFDQAIERVIEELRGAGEWQQGHILNAMHICVPHLEKSLGKLDKTKTIATYCGSGYRASNAASVLQRHGFKSVVNIPGSWTAWKKAGLPIEDQAQSRDTVVAPARQSLRHEGGCCLPFVDCVVKKEARGPIPFA